MLTLINTNRMYPPIAPVGLEYVASAAVRAGIHVEVLDLCLAKDPDRAISEHFVRRQPELVGLSFRNTDDSFWPKGQSFLPVLQGLLNRLRRCTDAPIALGGVGFSLFAEEIVAAVDADFGVRGDGEPAVVGLLGELRGARRFDRVSGLIWRDGGLLRSNPPAWPEALSVPTSRDLVDNRAYLRRGAQVGFETKRGCNRRCTYCADRLAKGTSVRTRHPAEVADEVEGLLGQGIDVLHTCDCEFNVPGDHARAICEELVRRSLGERLRWYAYLAVTPFDEDLARKMARAGCVGINFTGDSASDAMLRAYGQPHRREDLRRAVRLCRENGIAVMIDLLLGGPGETPETAEETIGFVKEIGPDCAGAALGVRLYPGTPVVRDLLARGPLESNPGVWRRYEGPVNLWKPTFYVSPALGSRPAQLVRELIAGDERFFEPSDPPEEVRPMGGSDHNYNDNTDLVRAIEAGSQGAYWDILRKLRLPGSGVPRGC